MRSEDAQDVKLDWRGSLLAPLSPRERESPLRWHSWFNRAETNAPFVLLAIPTVLSLVRADQTSAHRLTTLAIAVGAAVWLLLTPKLPSARVRENAAFAALTFAGVVGFGSALEARETYFLIFMVHGFFAAMRMRPLVMSILGVAVTSLLINTVANGGPVEALATAPVIWVTLVIV